MSSADQQCGRECSEWRFDERAIAYRQDDENSPSDEELLRCWSADDCDVCFRWWVERVYRDPRYLGIRRRLLKQWPGVDIDGLITDAVIAIHQKKPHVDNVAAYMTRILSYKAYDYLGLQRQRRVDYLDMANAGDEVQRRSIASDWQISDEKLEEALASCEQALSELLAQAIRLRYTDGLSVQQISDQLGVSRSTCNQRISRGRRSLLDCVANRLDIDLTSDLQ